MKSFLENVKMKNLLWLLVAPLVFSSILNVAMIFPVHANPEEAKVFVDPPESIYYTNTTKVSDNITVSVCIANMTNLAGFEFHLYWDPTLLTGLSMEEVLFTENTPPGEEGNIWKLAHEVASDHVVYSYTYMDIPKAEAGGYLPIDINVTTYPPNGIATVAIITLHVEKQPTKAEGFLDCALEITESVPGDVDGLVIPHTVEHGYYKLIYVWSPPETKPYFSVYPLSYEAAWLGEEFNVSVLINNLDAGWEAVGFEFKLGYNTTLLEVLDVTEGPWLPPFGGSPNQGTHFMCYVEDNYVLMGDYVWPDENGTWHPPLPSTDIPGSGVLAIISFKAIYQGPEAADCDLDLYDIIVANWTAGTIPLDPEEDGYYMMESNIKTLYHEIMVDTESYILVTVSNASISPVPMQFVISHKLLNFNASGIEGTTCFVNITIPNDFLWLEKPADYWLVLVGGDLITPDVSSNDTHTSLYFTFTLNRKPIQILGTDVVPEFPTNLFTMLSLIATLLVVAVIKVVWPRKGRKLSGAKEIT